MTDLISYLAESFRKAVDDKEVVVIAPTFEEFVVYAKRKLKENPPTSVFMMHGLGIHLADGTDLSLLEPLPEPELQQVAAMPVTRPRSVPGQSGITDTRSVPVFGGK